MYSNIKYIGGLHRMVCIFVPTNTDCTNIPKVLINNNIKIDYGNLRHIIDFGQKSKWQLFNNKKIAEDGEIRTSIAISFPAEKLIA